uniref:Putative polyol transporter 6 n=1 Tax=Aegilops tauschii TaxID=37682 RepID=M8BNR2_AEGTA
MGEEEEQRNNGGDGGGRKGGTNKYAVACSIIGSIISILMGYGEHNGASSPSSIYSADSGVMSGAMLFIKEDLKTNDTQLQVLAGILNVCALVGSLTAGRVSDWVGRRLTISLAACIFLAGSVLMGLAPNYATLLVGRCVAGVGVGSFGKPADTVFSDFGPQRNQILESTSWAASAFGSDFGSGFLKSDSAGFALWFRFCCAAAESVHKS